MSITLLDLEASEIASRKKIENKIPQNLMKNAQALIKALELIKADSGLDFKISSGYRCPALNRDKDVKGAKGSAHEVALAADITIFNDKVKNKKLYEHILSMGRAKKIKWDQLINEKNYT